MLSISLAAAAIAGLVRPARVRAFRFSLTFGLGVFFLGILMMATMTRAMMREGRRPKRIGRPAHYSNSAAIYPISPGPYGWSALRMRTRGSASLSQALPCNAPAALY